MKDLNEDHTLLKQITWMILWHEITWGETVTSPVKPRVILFWVEEHFKSFDHQHPLVTGTASSQKPCNMLALCPALLSGNTRRYLNIIYLQLHFEYL